MMGLARDIGLRPIGRTPFGVPPLRTSLSPPAAAAFRWRFGGRFAVLALIGAAGEGEEDILQVGTGGRKLAELSSTRANLEDVFLALTGRTYEDQNADTPAPEEPPKKRGRRNRR